MNENQHVSQGLFTLSSHWPSAVPLPTNLHSRVFNIFDQSTPQINSC